MISDADKAEAAATVESTADYRLWKCSWCEAEGRETWYDENGYLPPQNIPKDQISHGICPHHAKKAFENLKITLPQPVLTRKGSLRSAAPEISRPELTIGCGVNLADGGGDGPAPSGKATSLPSRADSPEPPRHLLVSGHSAPPVSDLPQCCGVNLSTQVPRVLADSHGCKSPVGVAGSLPVMQSGFLGESAESTLPSHGVGPLRPECF